MGPKPLDPRLDSRTNTLLEAIPPLLTDSHADSHTNALLTNPLLTA
jgi:hypothetical protein